MASIFKSVTFWAPLGRIEFNAATKNAFVVNGFTTSYWQSHDYCLEVAEPTFQTSSACRFYLWKISRQCVDGFWSRLVLEGWQQHRIFSMQLQWMLSIQCRQPRISSKEATEDAATQKPVAFTNIHKWTMLWPLLSTYLGHVKDVAHIQLAYLICLVIMMRSRMKSEMLYMLLRRIDWLQSLSTWLIISLSTTIRCTMSSSIWWWMALDGV